MAEPTTPPSEPKPTDPEVIMARKAVEAIAGKTPEEAVAILARLFRTVETKGL